MKKMILFATVASMFAVPAFAGQFLNVDGDYAAGAISGAGGFSVASGGIVKQKTFSDTGAIGEGDLKVTIDKNGVKKVDGTFRAAGYGVQTNTVQANGWGSAAVSAAGTTGGFNASVTKSGGGF